MLPCTLSAWTGIAGTVAVAGQPLLLLCWAAHSCLVLALPARLQLSLPGSGAPCLVLALSAWFWCSLPISCSPCPVLALPAQLQLSPPGSGAPCPATALPAWLLHSLHISRVPSSGSSAPCPSLALPAHLQLSLPGSCTPCPVPMPGGRLAWQALPVHTPWSSFVRLFPAAAFVLLPAHGCFGEGSLGATCASWPGTSVRPRCCSGGRGPSARCAQLFTSLDTFSTDTLLRQYGTCTVWCSKDVQQYSWLHSELKWTLSGDL